jgi:hypothetical protein
MAEIATDGAVQFMENNTIDYIENWRIRESSTLFEYYLKDLDYNDLIANMSVSAGAAVKMSNGQVLSLPIFEKAFLFPTRKRLYDDNEERNQVQPKLQTLYERGIAKRRNFSVFINGIKIPDSQVYVYASLYGTDLIIPARFWSSEHKNTLVCTVHDFSDGSYANKYQINSIGASLTGIPIPNKLQGKLQKKWIETYIAGKYIDPNKYTMTTQGTTCSIQLDPTIVPSDPYNIEVTIDGTIMNSYDNNYLSSSNDLFMFVPKDSQAVIETAIFLYMCDIYINGRKIPSDDILQSTYRHFMYKRTLPNDILTPPYNTRIVVSDKSVLAKSFADYINAFMEYEKMVSDDMATKQLAGDGLESYDVAPPFVNYETLTFPPDNKYIFDSEITRMMSNEQRVLKMIEENSHYLESLLRYHGVEEEIYTVERGNEPDTSAKMVPIILDTDDADNLNSGSRSIELYINDKKIPNSDMVLESKRKADFLNIPIQKFTMNGKDTIKLYRYKSNNQASESVRFIAEPSWAGSDTEIDVSTISSLSGALGEYNWTELRVFRQLDRTAESDYFYIDMGGASIYFGLVPNQPTNYKLRETIDNTGKKHLMLTIPAGSPINQNDIVYIVNPLFHASKKFVISENNDSINNESRLVLNIVKDGEMVPRFMSDYLTKVFVNGEIYIPDVDYFVIDPESNANLTSAVIIFRKRVNVGDVIEVVYTGTKNKFICGYTEIPVSNKYGFIFLSKLEFPFSLDYLDMFIGGRKLTKDDVVVYSDRLIRIKGIELPFQNVSVFTRFNSAYYNFKPYFDEYAQTGCMFDEYIKAFCATVIYDGDQIIDPNQKTINDIYENNQNGGEPPVNLPINPNPPIIDIIDPFLDRFGRDMNNDTNKVSKYFDANEYKHINFDEYLILLTKSQQAAHEVELDANSIEHAREDFNFDPNKHYRSIPEVYKVIADLFNIGALTEPMDSNETLVPYEDPLLTKFLYPSDVVDIDSNRIFEDDELVEDVVLDSNPTNTDEEE